MLPVLQADRQLCELGPLAKGDTLSLTAWLQHLRVVTSNNRMVINATLADAGASAKLLWVHDDCRCAGRHAFLCTLGVCLLSAGPCTLVAIWGRWRRRVSPAC